MKRKFLIVATVAFLGFISTTILYANQSISLLDKMFLIRSSEAPMNPCSINSPNFCECMDQDQINGCENAQLNKSYCQHYKHFVQQEVCNKHGEGVTLACRTACKEYPNVCNATLCRQHQNNPWQCLVTQFDYYLANCLDITNCKP
jgi:hypothetical protein